VTTEKQALVPLPLSQHTSRLWPIWLLGFILLIGLIGIGVWSSMQFQQIKNTAATQQFLLKQVLSKEDNRSDALQKLEDRLSKQILNISKQTQNLTKQSQQQAIQIEHNAMTLAQVGGSSRTDWLMAEAEYLLRLANQRISMEHDPNGAEAILRAADKVLAETQDPGVFPVRKAIAREQLALASVNMLDQDGVYLSLEAMIDRIELLNQSLMIKDTKNKLHHEANSQRPPLTQTQPLGIWEKIWQDSKSLLAKNLIIRRLDKPIAPLLAPEQTYYLKQNLRLMLEQAELALLKKDAPLYKKSLTKAQEWINQYFIKANPSVSSILDQLKKLAALDINPTLPDISESLRLLKDQVKLMYQQHKMNSPAHAEKTAKSGE
jgi:uroporphyrin-3 C-methyltransferase